MRQLIETMLQDPVKSVKTSTTLLPVWSPPPSPPSPLREVVIVGPTGQPEYFPLFIKSQQQVLKK